MSDFELEPGEILKEDPRIQKAFDDYMALGPDRSVMGLYRMYSAKVKEDPYAFIPSTDAAELSKWEANYSWRVRAYEYDAQAQSLFLKNRNENLSKLYDSHFNISQKFMDKALEGLDNLEAEDMSAKDVLDFMKESIKVQTQAREKLVALEDPRSQQDGSSGDFFDQIRKVILVQQNITINERPNS